MIIVIRPVYGPLFKYIITKTLHISGPSYSLIKKYLYCCEFITLSHLVSSHGVYISHLVRVARFCTNVLDFISKQNKCTEGCSKLKSLETRQVQERLVSTLEHMQVPKWDKGRCPME